MVDMRFQCCLFLLFLSAATSMGHSRRRRRARIRQTCAGSRGKHQRYGNSRRRQWWLWRRRYSYLIPSSSVNVRVTTSWVGGRQGKAYEAVRQGPPNEATNTTWPRGANPSHLNCQRKLGSNLRFSVCLPRYMGHVLGARLGSRSLAAARCKTTTWSVCAVTAA